MRNISSGGVCFDLVTSEMLTVGSEFEVEISVPQSLAGLAPATLINGKGRVCRIDQADRQCSPPAYLRVAIQFISPLQLNV